MRKNSALLAGLVVVVLWASAFPAIQVAAPAMGAIGLSFARLLIATVALVIVGVVTRIRLPRVRDVGWILACGFFGMTAYQLLLNWGEVYVPAGTASIIVAAAPLVSVAVARVLFTERVSLITIIGSAIALVGVVIVCLARTGVALSAAVWIVVAAMIVQGIYHPLQRPLLKRYSGLEVATYAMVTGTIMTLPVVPFDLDGLVDAGLAPWLAAIWLGVMPSALGFVLWAYAVGKMPVAVSTSLLYLVSPVAVLIAWVWLGELPVAAELLGGVVVLIGVGVISQLPRILASKGSRRRLINRGTQPAAPAHPDENATT